MNPHYNAYPVCPNCSGELEVNAWEAWCVGTEENPEACGFYCALTEGTESQSKFLAARLEELRRRGYDSPETALISEVLEWNHVHPEYEVVM